MFNPSEILQAVSRHFDHQLKYLYIPAGEGGDEEFRLTVVI
jgi:hypothetical protein